jgi:hypothetical protein
MMELVNDTFIEDLSTLLSSCAEGKNSRLSLKSIRSLKA